MVNLVLIWHINLYLLLHTLSPLASWTPWPPGFLPSPLVVPSARSSPQHWKLQASVPSHLLMLTLSVSSYIVFVVIYMLKTPKLLFPAQFPSTWIPDLYSQFAYSISPLGSLVNISTRSEINFWIPYKPVPSSSFPLCMRKNMFIYLGRKPWRITWHHILFLFPLYALTHTFYPSGKSVASTFKIHLEHKHLSLPPSLPSLCEPPPFLTWITAIIT